MYMYICIYVYIYIYIHDVACTRTHTGAREQVKNTTQAQENKHTPQCEYA